MSMQADIENVFYRAISSGVSSEQKLLNIKLEVYESLEWDSAAIDTARVMLEKGYDVPAYWHSLIKNWS